MADQNIAPAKLLSALPRILIPATLPSTALVPGVTAIEIPIWGTSPSFGPAPVPRNNPFPLPQNHKLRLSAQLSLFPQAASGIFAVESAGIVAFNGGGPNPANTVLLAAQAARLAALTALADGMIISVDNFTIDGNDLKAYQQGQNQLLNIWVSVVVNNTAGGAKNFLVAGLVEHFEMIFNTYDFPGIST